MGGGCHDKTPKQNYHKVTGHGWWSGSTRSNRLCHSKMRGKDITAGTKMLILLDLADVVSDAKPKHGSFNVVAKRHGVGGTVVAALWKAYGQYVLATIAAPVMDTDALLRRLEPKRNRRSGRKPRPAEDIQLRIAALKPET